MYILGIDTATNSGGVVLGRNQEVVALLMSKSPSRYSEILIDSIDFILKTQGLDVSQIDCLAVTIGPGSFTGIRIGLAAAKSIAQVRNIQIVPVVTLEALALRFSDRFDRIVAVMDARRQQVYAAAYQIEKTSINPLMKPWVGQPFDLAGNLPEGRLVCVGDGAHLYSETLQAARPDLEVLQVDNGLLESLCQLGFLGASRGLGRRAHDVEALYVRPPDAKLSSAE